MMSKARAHMVKQKGNKVRLGCLNLFIVLAPVSLPFSCFFFFPDIIQCIIQIDRQIDSQIGRQIERNTQLDRQTDRQIQIDMQIDRNTQLDRQTDRQIQIDRQTDRDRQIDRQTDKQTYTHNQLIAEVFNPQTLELGVYSEAKEAFVNT